MRKREVIAIKIINLKSNMILRARSKVLVFLLEKFIFELLLGMCSSKQTTSTPLNDKRVV